MVQIFFREFFNARKHKKMFMFNPNFFFVTF